MAKSHKFGQVCHFLWSEESPEKLDFLERGKRKEEGGRIKKPLKIKNTSQNLIYFCSLILPFIPIKDSHDDNIIFCTFQYPNDGFITFHSAIDV